MLVSNTTNHWEGKGHGSSNNNRVLFKSGPLSCSKVALGRGVSNKLQVSVGCFAALVQQAKWTRGPVTSRSHKKTPKTSTQCQPTADIFRKFHQVTNGVEILMIQRLLNVLIVGIGSHAEIQILISRLEACGTKHLCEIESP